ncbi:Oxidoreductase family, NAD-binding Rossmann fold protein [Clavispora lusitaniae]|uniref:Oxidoreductase family, NAD-binding Rossmann fold protein n=1 Tax=Clavispora lusitaniae TaxID=36911 RepID=UPI00202C204E|nr:Oxidoreductase family, NAD-binding Rossmann fold protein [Clavispora lusitaniae]
MTLSPPLSIIVVGAGLIGPRHAQHVKSNPSTTLSALIDPSPNAKKVAQDLQTPCYSSIEEYFVYLQENNLNAPDGALICTPNHTHIKIATDLASRGVNLLIEKPVSICPEEAKALKCFVQDKDVQVLVGHHRRFNPFIIAAKENLDSVGDVIAVQGSWALKKPLSYFTASPWRTDSRSGGGPLLINLIHDIDILQYLFGKIERVYAEPIKKQRTAFTNVDEGASIVMRFENGITGTFICADNVTSSFNFEAGTGENPLIPTDDKIEGFYRIFGSKGTLSVPDLTLYHQQDLPDHEHGWNSPVSQTTLLNKRSHLRQLLPFDAQLDHFVDIIRGKADPLCTIDDGMSSLLCIDAILKSLATELPERVKSVKDIEPDFEALGVVNT